MCLEHSLITVSLFFRYSAYVQYMYSYEYEAKKNISIYTLDIHKNSTKCHFLFKY